MKKIVEHSQRPTISYPRRGRKKKKKRPRSPRPFYSTQKEVINISWLSLLAIVVEATGKSITYTHGSTIRIAQSLVDKTFAVGGRSHA